MEVKRYQLDSYDSEPISTIDETDSDGPLCPAEVAPFKPCGKKMRRRKNGVTICPEHGEMH